MVWDDDAHVTKPALQSLAGLASIWTNPHATQQYYPLLHSAFWIEHRLWGDATMGYHLTNVLLHALAALLTVVLLQRLKVPGAAFAGILFTVHPVCVESVAWISEQKNTLSLVLYLLSALAYLRFDAGRKRSAYAAALALFLLALLTKTVTATLPAALLVVFWWKRGSLSLRRDVLPLLPWFAFALAGGLVTSWVERSMIGAAGPEFALSAPERVLLASRVVWFYLGKLLWPFGLMFIYPHWDVHASAASWIPFLACALLATAGLWILGRRARGPLAAWLLFVGGLFPALGFVNVYPFIFSYTADHFQYLASLPILASIAAGASALHGRLPAPLKAPALVLASLAVGTLAILSTAQSRTYQDGPTLYRTTLQQNPSCWMAHNNLGLWYESQGDTARALSEYEEALRLKDTLPMAHNNLGAILRRVPGRHDEARAHLERALELQPVYSEAANNLGVWFEDTGDLANAALRFRDALRMAPSNAEAANNLGSVLARTPGGLAEAMAQFREAIRLSPGFAAAHNNLGSALLQSPGGRASAVSEFQEAIRLNPGLAEAHLNLGNAWLGDPSRTADAAEEYQKAIRLNPNLGEAHNNLGLILNQERRPAEAVPEFREALRLMPGTSAIHFNLALALLHLPGRRAEAEQELEALLAADPGNEQARTLLLRVQAAPPE
jgi:Tfp pilus assembly protein PilF